MITALPAFPLAENLPFAETLHGFRAIEEALDSGSYFSASKLVGMAWESTEHALSMDISPRMAAQALQVSRICLKEALNDKDLQNDPYISAALLNVFTPEMEARRAKGPLGIMCVTYGRLLNMTARLRRAVIHTKDDHASSTEAHSLCFGDRTLLHARELEIAHIALLAGAGKVVYPSSPRERVPQASRSNGLSHHLYVVEGGVKVPLQVRRSASYHKESYVVTELNWAETTAAVEALGIDMATLAAEQHKGLLPPDATTRYLVDALLAERAGKISPVQMEVLQAVEAIVLGKVASAAELVGAQSAG